MMKGDNFVHKRKNFRIRQFVGREQEGRESLEQSPDLFSFFRNPKREKVEKSGKESVFELTSPMTAITA